MKRESDCWTITVLHSSTLDKKSSSSQHSAAFKELHRLAPLIQYELMIFFTVGVLI